MIQIVVLHEVLEIVVASKLQVKIRRIFPIIIFHEFELTNVASKLVVNVSTASAEQDPVVYRCICRARIPY